MEEKIENLKNLAAAYQAALQYDYCPTPEEAEALTDEIITDFPKSNFRNGAKLCEGQRPSEISGQIIDLISTL